VTRRAQLDNAGSFNQAARGDGILGARYRHESVHRRWGSRPAAGEVHSGPQGQLFIRWRHRYPYAVNDALASRDETVALSAPRPLVHNLRTGECTIAWSSAMQSSADECWRIAAECGHWAEESHDEATRLAFRQMAKAWAQLAFSQDFTPPERRPANPQSSEGSETSPDDEQIRHRFG
jgi:hypothetical protein